MRNEICIRAEPERIYRYARDTEHWPQFLPHYRFVRVLQRDGETSVLDMAAVRSGIPVRWRSEQIDDPATFAIRFRHLSGWTRGMNVEWSFERTHAGTWVRIDHELHFRFPVGSQFIGERVIGKFFVDHIAGKTLRCMKALAERG